MKFVTNIRTEASDLFQPSPYLDNNTAFVLLSCRHTSFINYAEGETWLNTDSVKTALDTFISANGLSTNTLAKQGLAWTVSTNIEHEFGASASWLSYNLFDEGLAFNDDSVLPWANNLSQIPEQLAKSLAAAGRIRLNTNVTRVAYDTTGVKVSTPGPPGATVRVMLGCQICMTGEGVGRAC